MIRLDAHIIRLEGACSVEDAELLLQHVQIAGAVIDWSGCTLLHTACLQVILAAGLPVAGRPAGPDLARWLAPKLPAAAPVTLIHPEI